MQFKSLKINETEMHFLIVHGCLLTPPPKLIAPPHAAPPPLKNEAPPSEKQAPPLKHERPFYEMIPRKSTINNNLKSS